LITDTTPLSKVIGGPLKLRIFFKFGAISIVPGINTNLELIGVSTFPFHFLKSELLQDNRRVVPFILCFDNIKDLRLSIQHICGPNLRSLGLLKDHFHQCFQRGVQADK
jgi:hypothetical protein